MKKYFFTLLLLFFSWRAWAIPFPDQVYCYGKDSNAHTFVSPPAGINMLKYAKANPLFVVTYHNFPDEAKVAFSYALKIWESLIASPVPIRVDATWYDGPAGVLGSAVPAEYRCASKGNPEGFPDLYCYYAIALAEKMAGKDLNSPLAADIIVNMNKNINWYLGTDGNCPAGCYDFVTVVLHEICHALAINGSIKVENGKGTWGAKGFSDKILPLVWDKYVINGSHQHLIDTLLFPVPSLSLYDQIVSGNIFFDSPIAIRYNGNTPVRLYAPATYDPGGSLLHLDENTFPAGNINSLMTPFLSMAEAIHHPGPVVLGIMAQIGWVHTYITPDSFKDIEDIHQDIAVSVTIESDSGHYPAKRLVYSYDNFSSSHVLVMGEAGHKDTAVIPAPHQIADVKFFFSVIDSFGRIYHLPVDSSLSPFVIHCGPDEVKPVIAHDSLTLIYEDVASLQFNAVVTDNIAVDSVWLEYYINTVRKPDVLFTLSTSSQYTANVVFATGDIKAGDSIRYRIRAVDRSSNKNVAWLPASGYFVIRVEKRPPVVVTYKNNFDSASNDFILNGFYIGTFPGFPGGALHSPHPYQATGKPMVYREYTAELKNTIKILPQGSFMAFDEIVLVEPNVAGVPFGQFGFYDYVIVEGSADGITWYAFENTGYNCRYNNDWYVAYHSAMDAGGNSIAMGNPSLFRRHLINLRNNKVFRAGDTIHVRFRLHSDAYFTGWGWAIDNLVIQDSSYVGASVSFAMVDVYPNPANEILRVVVEKLSGEQMVRITDLTGCLKKEQKIREPVTGIYVGDLPEGVYLVYVLADKVLVKAAPVVIVH